MRRADREVTSKEEILNILERCQTVRIAMHGGEYPYVVPVSFGLVRTGEQPTLYFHCAKQGLKCDYLAENGRVCVEADNFFKTQSVKGGITTRYESVIGFGVCEPVTERDELLRGLQSVLDHYGYESYPLASCGSMAGVRVYRVTLEQITGKCNPVEEE